MTVDGKEGLSHESLRKEVSLICTVLTIALLNPFTSLYLHSIHSWPSSEGVYHENVASLECGEVLWPEDTGKHPLSAAGVC